MFEPEDIHIRVIDQRIGAGIGGLDTVIRVLHIPTGILVEVPRVTSSQFNDREIAMNMVVSALTDPKFRKEVHNEEHMADK